MTPGIHAGGGPIAINAANGDQTVFTGLHQGLRQEIGLGVITVDQDGDLVSCRELFIWHSFFFLERGKTGILLGYEPIISAFLPLN